MARMGLYYVEDEIKSRGLGRELLCRHWLERERQKRKKSEKEYKNAGFSCTSAQPHKSS